MTRENSAEIPSPSRRALLKAAAAGGVFAVPLIASFSMDTASAQTVTQPVISSNMVVTGPGPMYCGNMSLSVPTSSFFAELRKLVSNVPTGPVVGLAGFQFRHDRDELSYELIVNGELSYFTVTTLAVFLFEDQTTAKVGKIAGPEFDCGPQAIPFMYSYFTSGDATVVVQLASGRSLEGTIARLDSFGPFEGTFRFIGSD